MDGLLAHFFPGALFFREVAFEYPADIGAECAFYFLEVVFFEVKFSVPEVEEFFLTDPFE